MKNNLKILLLGLLVSSLNAGEVQTGKGTFEVEGGFIGLNKAITSDITTYSLIEQHKNIFKSKWFYKYNLTWYDSEDAVQAQNSINSSSDSSPLSSTTSSTTLGVPSIDYRLQGLDINFVVGKDIVYKGENDYVGVGCVLGLSIPWIDSKKDDDNDDDSSDDAMDAMEKSKTELYTYKIGPSITARKTISKYFTIYGSGTYAYQTGTMKNDYADSDLSVNGIFQEYDFGIRFQPVSVDYKLGWLSISPRAYATVGYRYTSWDLSDINIDVTGTGTSITSSDFNMNSSIMYFGLGYSF